MLGKSRGAFLNDSDEGCTLAPALRCLLWVAAFTGHPFWLLAAAALSVHSGMHMRMSTNVYLELPGLPLFLAVILGVRLALFWWGFRKKRSWKVIETQFLKAQRPLVFALPFAWCYWIPIEGNVFGFVYLPFTMLGMVLFSPVVWWFSYHSFKELQSMDDLIETKVE